MATKIILYIATSEDGFIAEKDGSVAWLDKYNETGENYGYDEFLKQIDTVVMGNTTFEQVLGFGEYPYAGKKGYVFANQVKEDSNVTFVKGDVKEFVEKLDKNTTHNVWLIGGANLVNQFLKYNLIDEFIIFKMPTKLGEGIKLFEEDNFVSKLNLKQTKTYNLGVIESHYEK